MIKAGKSLSRGVKYDGHDYFNDATHLAVLNLFNDERAHRAALSARDPKGQLSAEAAQVALSPHMTRLGLVPSQMPDGDIDWREVAAEFCEELQHERARPAEPRPAEPETARARAIDPDVLAVLRECTSDERCVYLPARDLGRTLYAEMMKVLGDLGGKWNRKAGGILFADDPQPLLEVMQSTGTFTSPKDFGYFPTPAAAAAEVVEIADLRPGMRVFEPSAGRGGLALPCAAIVGTANVLCCELLPRNALVLREAGFTVIEGDFLTLTPQQLGARGYPLFDRLILNPPFGAQADMRHVEHAARFLKPDGRLVAIMSPSFEHRQTKLAQGFRDLLDCAGEKVRDLPAGTFRESGTDVRTVVVTLDAARLPWNQQPRDQEEFAAAESREYERMR